MKIINVIKQFPKKSSLFYKIKSFAKIYDPYYMSYTALLLITIN